MLARLHSQARATETTAKTKVVLPESGDRRVLEAAARALDEGLCQPLLIGDPEKVRRDLAVAGLRDDPQVLDPAADPERPRLEEWLETTLAERRMKVKEPRKLVLDPLYYGDLLVAHGRADGAVMGAVATTTETLRAALRVIGVDPRYQVVTSCFLMCLPDGRNLIYADCGVIPAPTPPQLADIAMQASETFRLLVGSEPRVALLSFSTLGSARHPKVDPVLEAKRILAERQVDFELDGELQADAALVPAVAARKAPESPVAGRANVLVFPDLNSGNIAYKLTERLAGARAIGPLLCGLDHPVHDLSRGCSVQDILDTMAITVLEATRRRKP